MWPDQVSSLGPLALESNALLTALCGQPYFRTGKLKTNETDIKLKE